jgi:hypothetical protein
VVVATDIELAAQGFATASEGFRPGSTGS